MKKGMILLLSGFLLLANPLAIHAQQIPAGQKQLQSELNKRGLSEEEVRNALLENGIQPDSIQFAGPEELIRIQAVIENLERQKQQKKPAVKEAEPIRIQKEKRPEFQETTSSVPDSLPAEKEPVNELFGHQYINIPWTGKASQLVANESYRLGSGDVISVSIWSQNAQFDKSFTVDATGYIRLLDASQRVFVRGLKVSDVRQKLQTRFRSYYQFEPGDFSLALESTRQINLSVFGEVNRPGAVSFSAAFNVIDALRYCGGVNENAGVRNIRVIGADGSIRTFDLYRYLDDPSVLEDVFLQDGDIIHVPLASRIIEFLGAVRRPGLYEVLEGETLEAMIRMAGGFTEDANRLFIQLERIEAEGRRIYDLESEFFRQGGKKFFLANGDILEVKRITREAHNFAVILGAVANPGRYERTDDMKISDLLQLGRIQPESKTDFAFLKRKQEDGTSTYVRLNLDSILQNRAGADLVLLDRDTLMVWPKQRFVDDGTITVEGAIRFPGAYPYDYTQKMYISDALLLAGGLRRDASPIAFIHRADPLKPNEKQYIRVNLERLDTSQFLHENLILESFDRIEILSKNLFTERTFVRISGPVNQPGEFQYGKNMTLKDLIILSGGFKLGASTKNIEISRVSILENKPTRVTVARVDFDKILEDRDNPAEAFYLEPYDHVKVRYVPEFEFQNDVEVTGEVQYPGIYTLASKNERISDVITKAGGLTVEAFTDGATLFRREDSLGYIVLKLNEALAAYDSRFNYILKDGDVIDIPKMKDFVTIRGATKAHELYGEKLLQNPIGINVPFHQSKRAGYYIKKYTGGLGENASRGEIYVEHPNGEIEKSRSLLFFNVYPEVRKGSVIRVGEKPKKPEQLNQGKEDVDWSKLISDTLAQAMTIFTLILLARQASN